MTEQNSDQTRISTTNLASGRMVAHYRIVEKIGAGGMGEVYLAEDTKLTRKVALKFLPPQIAHDPDVRARFTREAQSAAQLDHPNIVTIHEVSEWQGQPFFAMQYIDGKTVAHYCREGTLSIAKIVEITGLIAEGLAKAHSVGIIHRDIKSANIILDKEMRPKILDFGLASVQGGEMLTKAGSTLGTIAYMSPEQARGNELDQRSDLFSLGVVLYELLAGRTPFKLDSDAATMNKIINEDAEPLARYKADVPAELQRIVSKCLTKMPGERYQSAADLAADLRALGRSLAGSDGPSTAKVTAAKPSIAVLPFTNMSADPENEYFSDGLTEELLNVLAKNPDLKVTGRTSSFAFKGKQEDLRGIGQKLGVGTLLEGSVRKSGNRVRITAQLVSVADGFHLWSETFDRVLDDIFAVQDEIASSVSKAMHVKLVGISTTKRTINPECYALILRADHSQLQMTRESLSVALELYNKAIKIDPNEVRAWAGLSVTYGTRIAYGFTNWEDEYVLAREAAYKALALDEESAEAHEAVSFVCAALELKMREGLPHIRRAHELAPNNSAIVTSAAVWEMLFGNFDRAIELCKQAIELDPLNPWAHREMGRICTYARRDDEAWAATSRALEMSPDMATINTGLSWIAFLKGNFEEAKQLIAKEKVAGYRLCSLAMIEYGLGNKAESDRHLEALIAEGMQWSFQVTIVYGYRGELDKAFEWLEKAYEVRDAGIPLTKVSRFLDPLHSDPRWPEFLKKIGLD